MSTEFNKVKSGVIFTKAAQKQDLQSGDTIPEALGKLAKYMDVTDDALSNIQPILTFDSEPEYESLNPVTSGGLYDYIELQSPTYINTFSTESDLYSYSGNLTNNDYAFVGTGSGATYYMNVYQYKSEVIRDTIENIKTTPSGSNILKTLNEPALPSGNIQYKLDCYVTAVNNQSYGTSPVITVTFSDNTTTQITVPNANKTHIVKTYSKTIKAIQFMNSGQASNGYTDFEDIKILTTAGWNKLSYRLYNPTWDANQLSAINSGITSTKVTNYDNHIANKSNPHEVTKSQIGLGNVGNFKSVSTEASQGLTSAEQSNARTNINAQESLSFNGTYNASTNKVATESTVTNAINALDVSSQGGAGKYISEISETNGKVSATPTTMDTSLSSSSTNNNCPTSKTVYDDQQRQETEIGAVANAGAKNLFKNTAVSKTYLGVTFTVNEDGTVSLSGAATAAASVLEIGTVTPPAGSYIVSGCPAGGSWAPNPNKYRIRIAKNGAWLGDEKGTGYTVTVNGSDVISLQVNSAVGFDTAGLVFKPMIRPASITDSTYVPYAPTNYELYETKTEQNETNVIANLGAKNNADFNFGGVVQNGNVKPGTIVCTESNGIFSFSGASDDKNYAAYVLKQLLLKAGTYKISGVSGGSNTTYWMRIGTGTTDTALFNLYDAEREFNIASDTLITVQVVIYANQTVSNLVFKPMIRPAVITDDTFVPYAKTNRELTEKEQVNENNIAWNTNNGVKNLINNTAAASTENAGITWTKNADGSMTGNGTCTGTSGVRVVGTYGVHTYEAAKSIPKGTYVVAPTGKTRPNERFTLYLWSDSGATAQVVTIYTSAYEFTVTNDTTKYDFSVGFSGSNVQITNDTLYPMICPKFLYDNDNSYQPYALPNPVLTPAAIKAVDEGAKNLLINTAASQVVGGVTFTVNEDGTITANGTKTNNDWFFLSTGNSLAVGTYVLSSGLASQSDMNLRLIITTEGNLGSAIMATEGERQVHIKQLTSDYTGLYYAIRISSGATVNNVVFKPMLCTAEDYAVSPAFVPYALPNTTLTPAVIKAVDEGAKNVAQTESGSSTQYTQIKCTVPAGTYKIYFTSLASNDTDATNCQIYFLNESRQSIVSSRGLINRGTGVVSNDITVNSDAGWVWIYASDSLSHSSGDTVSFSGAMCCTAADFAVSQKFVPYAPTNRELYEKVDGLGTELVANTNLDNLNIGTYYCGGATIGATLLNSPTQQPFRLIVSYFQSPTNRMQKIIDFNTSTSEIAIYIRVKTSSGWKSWYKFEGSQVTS